MYISGKLVASYRYKANHYILCCTGDDTPNIRDLRSNFVRQHAAQWERLGLELGLKNYDITIISKNNAYNPSRVEDCCIAVLEQWLKEMPSPTWSKLDDAVKHIRLSSTTSHDNEGYYFSALNSLVPILQLLSCRTKPM